eukprot:TRINITY_DN1035_c0_g1_i2.p1 TRINITY_DN1035_c0_g1~~TRINITY_DN1035_c0_g1_i2.p1  ORF type:complete len:224 (-),score=33.31 TRINITY_DN1035_c0_g1_i2:139-810(-)
MIVICLEGCHGSGKTELCRLFQLAGYNVLDEAFLDMPSFSLHPQSLTMESIWVSNWVQRLLKVQMEYGDKRKDGKDTLFIADRSPYSAIFYARRQGKLLDPLIAEQIRELEEEVNLKIKTVYIRVETSLLWKRIQERLVREPERRKYREDSKLWMETTVDFYENRNWDFIIDNNTQEINDAMISLITQLDNQIPFFPFISQSPSSLHSFDNPSILKLVPPLIV